MLWRNVNNYLSTLQMLSDVWKCSPNSLWSYKWARQDIREAPGLQLREREHLLLKLTAKRTKGHVLVSEFQLPGASFFLFSLFLTVMWYQHWDKSSAAQISSLTVHNVLLNTSFSFLSWQGRLTHITTDVSTCTVRPEPSWRFESLSTEWIFAYSPIFPKWSDEWSVNCLRRNTNIHPLLSIFGNKMFSESL